MAGIQQQTPWASSPYATYGSPLSFVPQPIQQIQQIQALQQLLQITLQQIQQVQQAIQFLPQHVAQVVVQTLIQTQANPSALGAPGVGIPFQSVQPFGPQAQFGQPGGYVM